MTSELSELEATPLTALTGLDAMFLYSETPTTPMNVVATIILDPGKRAERGASRPVLDFDDIVARLEERLPLLPQFRRTLVEAPFGFDRPAWAETKQVDTHHHVLRVLAREPGGRSELAEVVAKAASARLDRSRPLWSLWVVEGLEHGNIALIIRAHHALLDGMSGAALLLHLFDRTAEEAVAPESRKPRSQEHMTPASPSPFEVLGHAIRHLPQRANGLVEAAEAIGRSAVRLAKASRGDGWGERQPVAPFAAPSTHFNRAVSAGRAVAYSRVPMRQIDKVKKTFGGTLNNVVLAGCTGALRQHLLERGELPDTPLVAAIPVSTRGGEHAPGGNRISAMMVRLPVQIEDPIERYVDIAAEYQLAKRFHAVLGRDAISAVAELAPSGLSERALQLYSQFRLADRHRPLSNLTISTVTGPRSKLTFRGATTQAIHPHGPLMDGSGLNITVMSYGGSVDVGVLTCWRSLPNPGELADVIAGEVEQLAKRARHAIPELSVLEALEVSSTKNTQSLPAAAGVVDTFQTIDRSTRRNSNAA